LNGSAVVNEAWYNILTPGFYPFLRQVSGLTPNTPYHWRLRICYRLAEAPFQSCERWLSIPRNGWNEADMRTGPGTYLPLIMR
jgi:hypothetical protein